jgi:hypothetical protein
VDVLTALARGGYPVFISRADGRQVLGKIVSVDVDEINVLEHDVPMRPGAKMLPIMLTSITELVIA